MAQVEAIDAIDSSDCVSVGNAHSGFYQGNHSSRLILRHKLRPQGSVCKTIIEVLCGDPAGPARPVLNSGDDLADLFGSIHHLKH